MNYHELLFLTIVGLTLSPVVWLVWYFRRLPPTLGYYHLAGAPEVEPVEPPVDNQMNCTVVYYVGGLFNSENCV